MEHLCLDCILKQFSPIVDCQRHLSKRIKLIKSSCANKEEKPPNVSVGLRLVSGENEETHHDKKMF